MSMMPCLQNARRIVGLERVKGRRGCNCSQPFPCFAYPSSICSKRTYFVSDKETQLKKRKRVCGYIQVEVKEALFDVIRACVGHVLHLPFFVLFACRYAVSHEGLLLIFRLGHNRSVRIGNHAYGFRLLRSGYALFRH